MKQWKKKDRKNALVLAIMVAISAVIFGWPIVNAMAEEPEKPMMECYYKSIVIEPGDCLWNIAEIYAESVEMSVPEYVRELKMMNRLADDQIDAGQYLIVKYVENQ